MVIAGNLSTLNVLEFFLEFWISVISVRNSDLIRLLYLLLAGLHSSAAGTTDNTLCRPRWVPTTSDPGSTSIAVGGTHDEQALPHMLLAAPLAAAPQSTAPSTAKTVVPFVAQSTTQPAMQFATEAIPKKSTMLFRYLQVDIFQILFFRLRIGTQLLDLLTSFSSPTKRHCPSLLSILANDSIVPAASGYR